MYFARRFAYLTFSPTRSLLRETTRMKTVIFAFVALLPFSARCQKDVLKTENIYVDTIFGSIENETFLFEKVEPTVTKLMMNNKLETSFHLRSPYFEVGTKMYYSFRRVSESAINFVEKTQFIGFATGSYKPFLQTGFMMTVGLGSNLQGKFAQSYTVEYFTRELGWNTVVHFEGSVLVTNEFHYDMNVSIMRRGFLWGGYLDNDVIGMCIGGYSRRHSIVKAIVSTEEVGQDRYWSWGAQTTLLLSLQRKTPKYIYK